MLSQVAVECEYRRRDHEGGGFPGTNDDVLAALHGIPSALQAAGVAPSRRKLAAFGHSAGSSPPSLALAVPWRQFPARCDATRRG